AASIIVGALSFLAGAILNAAAQNIAMLVIARSNPCTCTSSPTEHARSHKHKQFLQPQQNQHQLSLRFKCSSSNNDNSSGLNSSSVQAPTDSAAVG
ncbi:hypothetical protein S245_013831, partial [Arachis hypogaea]